MPQRPINKAAKRPSTGPQANRVKATFYLDPEHVIALEELRLRLLKETGKKIDKSELVRRAIELLVNQ